MACPYFTLPTTRVANRTSVIRQGESRQNGFCPIQSEDDLTYHKYLQLDNILTAQTLRSTLDGQKPVHDEHLFIITHQAFELWFRQILYEIDSISRILSAEYLEERKSLCVISRLNRVIAILKLCCDQFGVLETMTPQDFLDFRDTLGVASGFQSYQFRLMEIRFGVIDDLRVSYDRKSFLEAFPNNERQLLEKAQSEPSLLDLVNDWLSRTPGLKARSFDFWCRFKASVNSMLAEMKLATQDECDDVARERMLWRYDKTKKNFTELFDEEHHNNLLKLHERRLTYQAMQGALMIFFYRDEPRFHLPYQLLQSLMDLDRQFMKLRYNHTSMVQRMVGSKVGTGGSSGYLYLRSTCSDRYKIFLDLLNLSTYLVPRDRIPPLSSEMQKSLAIEGCFEIGPPRFLDERDPGYLTGSNPNVSIAKDTDDSVEMAVKKRNGTLV